MIAHVIQPKRAGKRSRLWSARIQIDGWPKLRTFALAVSDKRVAEQKMREIVIREERRLHGVGIAPEVIDGAKTPLLVHLTAYLDARGSHISAETITHYRKLLEKLFRELNWVRISDVTAARFETWQKRAGLSPKYVNDQLGAMRTFWRWMERRGHVVFDPLKNVQKLKNLSVGAYRRALTAAEIHRLLAVAPANRAAVYLLVIYTGLRRKELNLIKWGDFDLDALKPCVRIPGSDTKNHKSAFMDLRPEAVAAVRSLRPELAAPFEWAFRRETRVPSVAELKEDLKKAEISFLDQRLRRVDLHALRHTFGTLLQLADVSPRVAMDLMRHSDIRLTMRIYTDASQLPTREAVAALPSFAITKHDAQIHSQAGGIQGLAETCVGTI